MNVPRRHDHASRSHDSSDLAEVQWSAWFPTMPEGNFDMFTFISGYQSDPMNLMIQLATDGSSYPRVQDDQVYSSLVADVQAASTMEERHRLSRLVDRYIVEQHWFIWGARVPLMNVIQPWVIGFNGETELGSMDRQLMAARLWIDQDLKREMGY